MVRLLPEADETPQYRIKGKIYAGLNDHLGAVASILTTWLIGGDFYVLAVGSDGQSLILDYIIPRVSSNLSRKTHRTRSIRACWPISTTLWS